MRARDRLPGDRRHEVLRARRDQGRDRLPDAARPTRRTSSASRASPTRRGAGSARPRCRASSRTPRRWAITVWDAAADAGARCPGSGTAAVKRARALHGRRWARCASAPSSGVPVGDLLEARAARDRLPRRARGRAHDRGAGPDREPRGAGRGRARVRRRAPRPAQDTLDVFLQQIALVADADTRSDDEGLVTLMTLHNAKGLEYPIVFIIGCEEGVFPHSRALDEGGARGGAAALLRRHHARDARPVPDLRAPARGVRRRRATGCAAASSTRSRPSSPTARRRPGSAPARSRGAAARRRLAGAAAVAASARRARAAPAPAGSFRHRRRRRARRVRRGRRHRRRARRRSSSCASPATAPSAS